VTVAAAVGDHAGGLVQTSVRLGAVVMVLVFMVLFSCEWWCVTCSL
jgi:hypothetical protein